MTLKEMVLEKILHGERVAAYKCYNEIWYVVIWNKQTYIHYTQKLTTQGAKFLWYLSANVLAPKWKCQAKEFEVKAHQTPAPLST